MSDRNPLHASPQHVANSWRDIPAARMWPSISSGDRSSCMMHVMKKLPSTGVGVGIGQDMEVLFVRRGTSESRAKWQLGGLGLFRRRLCFGRTRNGLIILYQGQYPRAGSLLMLWMILIDGRRDGSCAIVQPRCSLRQASYSWSSTGNSLFHQSMYMVASLK
jgi:hypothetical protein